MRRRSVSGKTVFCGCYFCADVADDFVMSLGGHWVQAHGESFILLVGNKVDFGAEELSNQGAGIVDIGNGDNGAK